LGFRILVSPPPREDRDPLTFKTTVAGVTFANADGSSRQDAIRTLSARVPVRLVREPNNAHDPYAVAVFTPEGRQIGYVPRGDMRLALHLDRGGQVTARVLSLTGSEPFIARFIRAFRKTRGCVVEITRHAFDPAFEAARANDNAGIRTLLEQAREVEDSSPDGALELYARATHLAGRLDAEHLHWRSERLPIDRITMILVKAKKYEAARQAVLDYRSQKDPLGLDATTTAALQKRAARIEEILAKSKTSQARE
jgi:hypothetical protein